MLQEGIWTLGIARIQQWKLWPCPWAACSSQPSSSSFDTVHPHLFEDTGSIIHGTGEVEVPVCIVSLAQHGMEWLLMPRHPDSYIRVNWQQCTGYIKNICFFNGWVWQDLLTVAWWAGLYCEPVICDSDFVRTFLQFQLKFCLLCLMQNFVQAWWITVLLLVILKLNWDPPWQSTIFIDAWLDLSLSLVLADSCLVHLPSWVGDLLPCGSELTKGTSSELSSWPFFLKEEKRKKLEFSGFFHDIMLSCKMWSFLHENKWQKTSIVVMWLETDVCSETDLTWFDDTYPGLAAVKVDKNVFTTDITWHHQRLSEREAA